MLRNSIEAGAGQCRPSMMYHHGAEATLLALALQVAVASATSPRIDYGALLERENVEEKLRLLGPRALLGGHIESTIQLDNRDCVRDLALYIQAINHRKSWALQMLDASSQIPSGILKGNVMDLGMFDECMEVRGVADVNIVTGRHCIYEINPALYKKAFLLNPKLSICVPYTCTSEDVFQLVNRTIESNNKLKNLGVSVASATCSNINRSPINGTIFCCVVAVYIYIALILLCSVFDVTSKRFHFKYSESPLLQKFARLSVVRNGGAILSSKAQQDDLPFIHGIRVISNAWIVLVHEYFLHFYGTNINVLEIREWLASWNSVLPLLGMFSVDTFFTLSGFLVAYTYFKKMYRNHINLPFYYLHRFIRLTLPVMIITLYVYVYFPTLGSGMNFERILEIFVKGLPTKWWAFLLYVYNFVERDNYSLFHFWSLSVDMQLFWISPLILYPLHKSPKLGIIIVGLLILASVTASASIVGFKRYAAIYVTHEPNMEVFLESIKDVYQMSYTRASSWLLGILFGYEIAFQNVKPNKRIIWVGWLLTFSALVFCIFGIRSFTNKQYMYNPMWEILFAAIARPFWAFSICWLIYASVHGFAGPISTILSSKVFLPLSKLSYSIYLVHVVFPLLRFGSSRTPLYFNDYLIFDSYVSHMVMSIVLAFFFSLVFEVPMLILDDMIFSKKRKFSSTANKTQ